MTQLSDRLASLTGDIRRFLTLLEKEALALASGDAEGLTALLNERQALSQEIAEHWKSLASQLGLPAQAGFPALRDKALAESGAQAAAWRELENLSREASRLNQVNGRLIEEQMRRNQAAMQVLQNAAANRGIYGADGRVSDFLNVNRSIDSA